MCSCMRERMNEYEFALRRTTVFDVFGSAVSFCKKTVFVL